MHTTATVDYGIVLSGEPILELDDGVKLTLRPGTPTSRTGRAPVVEQGRYAGRLGGDAHRCRARDGPLTET